MSVYLLKRLAGLAPLFFGITMVSFAVIHLSPGDPVSARAGLDPKVSAQAREKLTKLYGLDEPLHAQYGGWLKRLASFDFGASFVDGQKVTHKIAQAIPVTLLINFLTLLVVFFIGIPLGVAEAVGKNSFFDKATGAFVLAGISVPGFWMALLLMSFFGVQLRLLPVSGLYSVDFDDLSAWGKAADLAKHLALPLLVASFTSLAGITRFMRASMIEALAKDYVRTARAKGLPEKKVVYGHALKNALLPVITLAGLSVPGLLGGSVIFETIFSLPGIGRLFFGSVMSRDYPVIMGILVLGAALTLLGNLLADLAYGLADPRIRASEWRKG